MRIHQQTDKVRCFALIALVVIGAYIPSGVVAAEREVPVAVKVLDPDIMLYGRPYPKISPDRKWVAYISKGFVCVCNVGQPNPRQLCEVPGTWTHFLARPENAHAGGDFGKLARGLDRDASDALLKNITSTVYGLQWTDDSQGVTYCLVSYDVTNKKSLSDIRYAPLKGKVVNLANIEKGFAELPVGNDLWITHDRKFLVTQGYKKALIWALAANSPRATPFLNLTPSSMSGRWIGIEKDTRQLVITDENFNVVKRSDEFRPARSFGSKLDWSLDERFVILRNQIGFDYYSNWEGFWMNLDTGEKRELKGRFMDEQIAFTGRGGEFFRCGQDGVQAKWSGDQITGAHLTVVPGDAKSPPRDLWRIAVDPKDFKRIPMLNQPGYPSVHLSPDGNLFAVRIPQPPAGSPGLIWTLVDRDGHQWRCPGKENKNNISPYNVVGFAGAGRSIVAYDEKQLFAVPVVSIMVSSNKSP
jgi:hypothetical protein